MERADRGPAPSPRTGMPMSSLIHFLASSDHPVARIVRRARRAVLNFTLPAPRAVFVPLLATFLGLRHAYYFAKRVFVCEPFFKAYCTRYGRGVRTGTYIHWVQGKGTDPPGRRRARRRQVQLHVRRPVFPRPDAGGGGPHRPEPRLLVRGRAADHDREALPRRQRRLDGRHERPSDRPRRSAGRACRPRPRR